MRKKLLLADDSITIQKVVELTFPSDEFEVQTAGNGRLAVDKALTFLPDIVLCDVIMPQLDGYQVCEALRATAELKNVPIILLNGAFEPYDADRARAVGALGNVSKPFDPPALVARVKEILTEHATGAFARPDTSLSLDDNDSVAPLPLPDDPRTMEMGTPTTLPAATPDETGTPDFAYDDSETAPVSTVEVPLDIRELAARSLSLDAPVFAEPEPEVLNTEAELSDFSETLHGPLDDEAEAAPMEEMEPVEHGVIEPSAEMEPIEEIEPSAPAELEAPSAHAEFEAPMERSPDSLPEPLSDPEPLPEPLPDPLPDPTMDEPAAFEATVPEAVDFEAGPAENAIPEALADSHPEAQPEAAPEMESAAAEPEAEFDAENRTAAAMAEPLAPEPEPAAEPEPEIAAAPEPPLVAAVADAVPAVTVAVLAAPPPKAPAVSVTAIVPPAPEPMAAGAFDALVGLADAPAQVSTAAPPPLAPLPSAEVAVPVDMVQQIAQRVISQVSERVIREIAWDVIPGLAEKLIKAEIERIKARAESERE